MAAQMEKEISFSSSQTSKIQETVTAPPLMLQSSDEDLDLGISQESEETLNYQDIDILLEFGIPASDIEQLKAKGIMTVRGVQTAIHRLELSGMKVIKIEKLKAACDRLTANMAGCVQDGFQTAKQLCVERKSIFKISTGSKNLDDLLEGGIESGSITEVFGESSCGKTQLCYTLCITAQIPSSILKRGKGYNGGKVIFIDTENTFRPDRIKKIAQSYNLVEDKVLNNILYARALNSVHQYELLRKLPARLHEDPGIYKLLIVDSIVALFRADYASGSGINIAQRQQHLCRMMTRLQEIAEEYNIAVLVTNHVTSDMQPPINDNAANFRLSAMGGLNTPHYKPAGGNAIAQTSTTRLCFRRVGDSGLRIAKVIGSPQLQEREAKFIIDVSGIKDPPLDEDEDDTEID